MYKNPFMSPTHGIDSAGVKGFDEAGAERTCPQWQDFAGFKVDPAMDLLCNVTLGHELPSMSLFYPFHLCVPEPTQKEQ